MPNEPGLRIIHVLRAPVGGLFRHVRDLARAQAMRGHLVGVVVDASTGDGLTEVRLDELRPALALGLHRTPMSRNLGAADVGATRRTLALAREHTADVLHGHGAKGGAYARLAARLLRRERRRVAAFYTPHGGSLHFDPASLEGRAFMAAERLLARISDGIVFESAYSERAFLAKVGRPGCRTAIVHNGLLPDELAPVWAEPDAADILFIGELRALKGVDVLLEAIARLPTGLATTALVVGDGPDASRFRHQSATLGLDGRILFASPMPAREAFRRGRILVMPSRAESFPYVALEGAAAGLPLVASDVGGIPEIVAGTDTRLVPPGDATALAAAIASALADPAVSAVRARRLAASVATRFTVAGMTDAILALYGEALSIATLAEGRAREPAA